MLRSSTYEAWLEGTQEILTPCYTGCCSIKTSKWTRSCGMKQPPMGICSYFLWWTTTMLSCSRLWPFAFMRYVLPWQIGNNSYSLFSGFHVSARQKARDMGSQFPLPDRIVGTLEDHEEVMEACLTHSLIMVPGLWETVTDCMMQLHCVTYIQGPINLSRTWCILLVLNCLLCLWFVGPSNLMSVRSLQWSSNVNSSCCTENKGVWHTDNWTKVLFNLAESKAVCTSILALGFTCMWIVNSYSGGLNIIYLAVL